MALFSLFQAFGIVSELLLVRVVSHVAAVHELDVHAGERDEQGHYPEGSINDLVEKRLVQLAERSAEFGKEGNE